MIIAPAPLWLAPSGHVLVETSEHQAPQAAEIFASYGLQPRICHSVDLDATVVIGTKSDFKREQD